MRVTGQGILRIGRIVKLENAATTFLFDRGEYWQGVKTALDEATSQGEYNRLLDFENRDLRIREQRHSCYCLFEQVLSEHPSLAERAPYDPKEVFFDFVSEARNGLDAHQEWSPREKDFRELEFLSGLQKGLRERGANSLVLARILRL